MEKFCAHEVNQEWKKECAEDVHIVGVLTFHFIRTH